MKKILIVDDTEDILEELSDILEMEGYQVSKADDAKKGFELINQETPDLIITDPFTRNIDGFSFLEQVKLSGKYVTIPVIILSTDSNNITKERAFTLNIEDYLQKPCGADSLIAAVQAVVG
ncbi:response regulator [Fulvivirga sp. M361]|uniref:response regulator transcription factor n=1 Tax=Fulvivirga sp. M361 TaxID=2594266 RepID=UPI001179ABC1|nr:response regulator [Fulvivirga sp. M361]TRX47196.1 response regulator [Fulvivirga sp. M361]